MGGALSAWIGGLECGGERRRAARRVPALNEPLGRVRLRTGGDLSVLDLSSGGALVEGGARLLPGTHVDVHVVTREGRLLVRSRVVRAWVSALSADSVAYRGALVFDRAVDIAPGYSLPVEAVPAAASLGTPYPSAAA